MQPKLNRLKNGDVQTLSYGTNKQIPIIRKIYQAQWNGLNNAGVQVPSGVYIYKLEAGNLLQTKKMVLLK